MLFRSVDAKAGQHGIHVTAQDLDLWQFRHGRPLPHVGRRSRAAFIRSGSHFKSMRKDVRDFWLKACRARASDSPQRATVLTARMEKLRSWSGKRRSATFKARCRHKKAPPDDGQGLGDAVAMDPLLPQAEECGGVGCRDQIGRAHV